MSVNIQVDSKVKERGEAVLDDLGFDGPRRGATAAQESRRTICSPMNSSRPTRKALR